MESTSTGNFVYLSNDRAAMLKQDGKIRFFKRHARGMWNEIRTSDLGFLTKDDHQRIKTLVPTPKVPAIEASLREQLDAAAAHIMDLEMLVGRCKELVGQLPKVGPVIAELRKLLGVQDA